MTWFRVDDSFAFHAKAVGVGNAALGLWVRAGAWSAQQLKDGVVPAHMVKALGGTRQQALALIAFGLWEQLEDGSFLFHDWHLYQPTSAEVKAERLARSEVKAKAGKAGGIASGVSRRVNKEANAKQNEAEPKQTVEANAKQNEAPALPDPALPSSASQTKHTIPPDWRPDVADLAWATDKAPLVNIEREAERFVNYWLDRGTKRPGWSRSWRNWLLEAQERAEKRPSLRAVGQTPEPLTVEQMRGRRL